LASKYWRIAGVSDEGAGVGTAEGRVPGASAIDYYYSVIVLALDTTTRAGSCALACDGEVREEGGEAGQSHGERLPGALMALLDRAGVMLQDVDLFAVATGPGSFTGIRVGIATMQGLAFAEGKPLTGISAFDALARIAGREPDESASVMARPIATWIDAWRGDIFAALFQSGRQIQGPSVEPPAQVLDRVAALHPVFIGDAAAVYADLIRSRLGPDAVASPAAPLLAGTIAQLAAAAAEAGHRPPPDAIVPLYVRRTDAELSRDARTLR
jgi:tRNA threonylcarbamoyladenosine biosynthesis protein TsaB